MDSFNLNITSIKTVYFYSSPQWKRQVYEKRHANGLVFLTCGNVKYHYGNEYLYAQKGDILSFSDNIPYSGVRLTDEPVDCYVIDFKTTDTPKFTENRESKKSLAALQKVGRRNLIPVRLFFTILFFTPF